MTTLNKAEASLVRDLMQHAAWDVVQRFYEKRLIAIQSKEITGANEFETLRMLHKNQGAAEELINFFEALDRGATE